MEDKNKVLKVGVYLLSSIIILGTAMVYPLCVLHSDYPWWPCLLIHPLALGIVLTKDIGNKWVDGVINERKENTKMLEIALKAIKK